MAARGGSSTKKTKKSQAIELSADMEECLSILQQLMQKEEAAAFNEPVDWEALGLPDYPDIVKHPMDLGTVLNKLEGGDYHNDPDQFATDVRLVWSNSKQYNQPGSGIYLIADKLSKLFEKKFSKISRAPKIEPKFDKASREITADDKVKFIKLLNSLTNEQVGQVVQTLEGRCPEALQEVDDDDLDIEITKIDASTLLALNDFAETCLAQNKKRKA